MGRPDGQVARARSARSVALAFATLPGSQGTPATQCDREVQHARPPSFQYTGGSPNFAPAGRSQSLVGQMARQIGQAEGRSRKPFRNAQTESLICGTDETTFSTGSEFDMDSFPVSGTTACFPQLPYVLLSNGETWGTRARGDSLQTGRSVSYLLHRPPQHA